MERINLGTHEEKRFTGKKMIAGNIHLSESGTKTVGRLLQANTVVLPAHESILLSIPAKSQTLILPLDAEIVLADSVEKCVDLGELLIYDHGLENENLLVRNPSNEHATFFLQFTCTTDTCSSGFSIARLSPQTDGKKDHLITVEGSSKALSLHFGEFAARKKGVLELKENKPYLFVYVLHGCFEITDRLLNDGDSLILYGMEAAELKSLEDGSVLFTINY